MSPAVIRVPHRTLQFVDEERYEIVHGCVVEKPLRRAADTYLASLLAYFLNGFAVPRRFGIARL